MADTLETPAASPQPNGVHHMSSFVAQRGACIVCPQVVGSHIEGSINANIQVHMHQTERHLPESSSTDWDLVRKVQAEFKQNLKRKLEGILEGIASRSNMTLDEWIHPELFISVGQNKEEYYEIWRTSNYKLISCNDLFKALPGQNGRSVVITKGAAGIGKTVSVQKFILDWAEEKANEDVDFMFMLPFCELNLIQDDINLHQLLCHFYSKLSVLDSKVYEQCKVVFIFDGLEECRPELLQLLKNEDNSESEEDETVDVLISDIIRGDLVPSALVWVTSKTEAPDEISAYIGHVTEFHGFSDAQMEAYLRKKIHHRDKANRILLNIKTTWSLRLMCHMPVFCWITATALERVYDDYINTDLPNTLTEILTCFLMEGYEALKLAMLSDDDVELFVSLGELAFKHAGKHSGITEDDLREYGIEPGKATVQSEVLPRVFVEITPVSYSSKCYKFLHPSIQSYLAALFVLKSFTCDNNMQLKPSQYIDFFKRCEGTSDSDSPEYEHGETEGQSMLYNLLRRAVCNAAFSTLVKVWLPTDRHLDLFHPLLFGLALNCDQKLPCKLVGDCKQDQISIQKTIRYIKYVLKIKNKSLDHEQCVNLLRCLAEIKDSSFEEEMQTFISPCSDTKERLSTSQCSVFVHLVHMSEAVLDELDGLRLCSSAVGQWRLVSLVKFCRKARVRPEHASGIMSAILSPTSHLKKLEFSNGSFYECESLLEALKSPAFRLEELHFTHVEIPFFNKLHLNPPPQRSWSDIIRAVLLSSHSQPHTLKMMDCRLGDDSCEVLAKALQSTYSGLMELDLSYNRVTDTGATNIYCKLSHSKCDLEKLRLSNCIYITEASCRTLASVLPRSRLRELYLDGCRLGDAGVQVLSGGMTHPNQLHILGLSHCYLTEGCCEALASVLMSDSSPLRQLDLSNNDLQDLGVKLISEGLKSSHCTLENLRLSGCMITEEGCSSLASALSSNPSHLKELDLSYNHPGDSGVKLLAARLEDPHCSLETLSLYKCGEQRMKTGLNKYGYYGESVLTCQQDVETWNNEFVKSSFGEQEKLYWQLEWRVPVDFGMKYKGSTRRYFSFDKDLSRIPAKLSSSGSAGVYLDWSAGTLSFSWDHNLYTYHHRFTKPLHPFVKLKKNLNCWVQTF